MHRTDTHTRRIYCVDVAASFAKHRADLVAVAKAEDLTVILDSADGFVAEGFDHCKSRIRYLAGSIDQPFANGPSLTCMDGHLIYHTLFLPKSAKPEQSRRTQIGKQIGGNCHDV